MLGDIPATHLHTNIFCDCRVIDIETFFMTIIGQHIYGQWLLWINVSTQCPAHQANHVKLFVSLFGVTLTVQSVHVCGKQIVHITEQSLTPDSTYKPHSLMRLHKASLKRSTKKLLLEPKLISTTYPTVSSGVSSSVWKSLVTFLKIKRGKKHDPLQQRRKRRIGFFRSCQGSKPGKSFKHFVHESQSQCNWSSPSCMRMKIVAGAFPRSTSTLHVRKMYRERKR